MHSENLVKMANNIGAFFQAEPDHAVAVQGVVDHLHKFWEPRMRRQIIAHLQAGGEGLSPLAREAVAVLMNEQQKNAA
ncbi:formate dehydrogenase, delta subunit [Methylococcus capsulatus str. Bath]|uniref:Formate dehydrogenase, delta subunit n=2 Tax=Methylococcus capsulatus TaxID=414 RepID=Q608V0_METCA|nr:formate dehydrogenase, delta subunit [Methylococcus capsulatus str. Bath]QXP88902.1 formate dehydrogenase subunit delta [Methylococcus capsulatus]QXP92069.1 formate dehydrogenase subunit delta [Methylococcus capsulatus]QXP95139.1 formate dehydrogenase subunit delta [Methylococcus capsulatus]